MPKQKVDKTFIIKQSIKLFREKTYDNISMADIAAACGILKGSLYHYFDGKEALMKEVILTIHDYFKQKIFNHAYNEELNGYERLQLVTTELEKVFVDDENQKILGNIGVETASIHPAFAENIKEFFLDYFKAIKTIYAYKYPDKVAEELAERSVSEVEGSIMMSRIFNEQSYLKNTHKRLLQRLQD